MSTETYVTVTSDGERHFPGVDDADASALPLGSGRVVPEGDPVHLGALSSYTECALCGARLAAPVQS